MEIEFINSKSSVKKNMNQYFDADESDDLKSIIEIRPEKRII